MQIHIDTEENPLEKSDIKAISTRLGENTGLFLWEAIKKDRDPRAEYVKHWLGMEVL